MGAKRHLGLGPFSSASVPVLTVCCGLHVPSQVPVLNPNPSTTV